MPTLTADSYADLVRVITENAADVQAGVYEFQVDPEWVREMSAEAVAFFASRPNESLAVARSPHTPLETLRSLLRRNPGLYGPLIAGNPAATPELLSEVANDCVASEPAARAIVEHPKANAAAFRTLSASPNVTVQTIVANSERTPAECLAQLAKSSASGIRAAVAKNAAAPAATLDMLRRDTDGSVKDGLHRNLRLRKEEGRCMRCGEPIGAVRKAFGSDICGRH